MGLYSITSALFYQQPYLGVRDFYLDNFNKFYVIVKYMFQSNHPIKLIKAYQISDIIIIVCCCSCCYCFCCQVNMLLNIFIGLTGT